MIGNELHSHDDNEGFLAALCSRARSHGACIVECFRCERCKADNVMAHSWSEVVVCMYCKHRQPSRVPRLPVQGEVTKEMLSVALDTVRAAYPEVSDEARDFIDKTLADKPAIQLAAASLSALEARRALDLVVSTARTLAECIAAPKQTGG